MINAYHKKYIEAKNQMRQKKKSDQFEAKIEHFKNEACKLFDIATYKYTNFATCTCTEERKVPVLEQAFLHDQRTTRIVRISAVDVNESQKLLKRSKRNTRKHMTQNLYVEDIPSCSFSQIDDSSETSISIHSGGKTWQAPPMGYLFSSFELITIQTSIYLH